MPEARRVELRQAWEWTCEDCGRDNFARSVAVELSEDERALLDEALGIDPDDHVATDWVAAPDVVTCCHCGAEFEADALGEEGSDDELF